MTDEEMEEMIAALAQKDSDFLEKFVRKVLKLSADYWGRQTEEKHTASPLNPSTDYCQTFDEWFRLRVAAVHLDDEMKSGLDRRDAMDWDESENPDGG